MKKLANLLTKNMMFDNSCEYCQETIKEAESSFNKNIPFTVEFIPDKNSCGNTTHWHIAIIFRSQNNN